MPHEFRELPAGLRPRTVMARAGLLRSQYMETCEAIYMNSGYVYRTAEEAESAFAQDGSRFVYSRYANPTVNMLEERLRLLEGAEGCRVTASGMAAVFAALASRSRPATASSRRARSSIPATMSSRRSCRAMASRPCWSMAATSTPGSGRWRPGVKAVFCESPSNPTLELVDLAAVAELTHRAGGVLVVDNVFATPLLQRPLQLGADIVCYSATKHIDGQGRSLGGAVLGSDKFVRESLMPFLRHTGPALSPSMPGCC